jgi:hypothetical protein
MIRFSELFPTYVFKTLFFASITLILIGSFALDLRAQRKGPSGSENESPLFQEYRGVRIGMTAEEARKKLGNPTDKGEEQDFFVFNENETAQVVYDKSHKVTALSFDFTSAAHEVPSSKTLFGSDVPPRPDGSVYRMVRYPKAGYWVSYSRTSGGTPLTSVTLQKID